ncbi:amino acid transporter [Silvibacterium bohemicum]|uniref:Amino acid transporter n=1 Tax=Silvibacterium bohemicum TaxID=1577686 RepID=A0A841K4S8_9BACT|nr:APC family permease [Silvibacterium bohemicum]MBB6146949.1 amino acid transporter [Silvibacterium bohemicum]
MQILDLLFGKPLANSEERGEQVGPSAGLPIFGLDALSSAAYGPEAALTLLIPLGLAGVHLIVPISTAIIILLVIVYFSYRQTIEAYPHGGGSYTVATENLGDGAGLLAASALMIDYILTAAVGISAGVGALVSAVPALQSHLLGLCLLILLILTLVNMRGVRDTGVAFLIPTYLFLGTLLIVIGWGLVRVVTGGGHPVPVVAPPHLPPATEMIGLWLLLKVFASGCTAMTGVEAVSNGVMAFRQPTTKNAKFTLTIIIALLIVLLAGIALLCRFYGIGATDPSGAGYQSVLSQLIGAVMGRGWFYYLTIASILLVLSLSANTAFADFPRLTKAIAFHDYLPHVFTLRGRRLLHSHGIYALVFFTAVLLILFGGVTDRLIPLYAIGAFLAFTLSQAGMVVHWRKNKGPGSTVRMVVNGIGAVATGSTLLVVLVAKFVAGAWVTALLVPLLIFTMTRVRRHYERVNRETANAQPLRVENIKPPVVIIPLDRWSRITEKGLRFALSMSPEIIAVHVDTEDNSMSICDDWDHMIAGPLKAANLPVPQLVNLKSPYRFILAPVVDFVLNKELELENRQIAVLVPELVVKHWWENLLHNQRANVLKLLLLLKGNQRILVINIPWYLQRP